MSTLFDLTGAWLELYNMADDPDMQDEFETWFDTMEGLEGEIEDKADGYAKVMKDLDGQAAAIKKEEERLAARRKTIENRVEYMKSKLKEMMTVTGKTKFKTNLFSYGIQKNPASVVIDKEAEIPMGYWIPQQPKLDKKSIGEWLKEGNECSWAHLSQTESLRIR